jgi:hypothetical protein
VEKGRVCGFLSVSCEVWLLLSMGEAQSYLLELAPVGAVSSWSVEDVFVIGRDFAGSAYRTPQDIQLHE